MSRIIKSQIADLMLWGSIPLWAVLGYWEQKLSLTDAGQKWVQSMLVLVVVGWAFIWYWIGEQDRLAHYKSQNSWQSEKHSVETEFIVQRETTIFSDDAIFVEEMKDNALLEMAEKSYVTDH